MTTLSQPTRHRPTSEEALREELLRPWPKISVRAGAVVLLLAGAVVWGVQGTKAAPTELIDGIPNIVDFVRRMFPPEFETETKSLQTPAIGLPFGLTVPRLGLPV